MQIILIHPVVSAGQGGLRSWITLYIYAYLILFLICYPFMRELTAENIVCVNFHRIGK